jgi:hypothetical protein
VTCRVLTPERTGAYYTLFTRSQATSTSLPLPSCLLHAPLRLLLWFFSAFSSFSSSVSSMTLKAVLAKRKREHQDAVGEALLTPGAASSIATDISSRPTRARSTRATSTHSLPSAAPTAPSSITVLSDDALTPWDLDRLHAPPETLEGIPVVVEDSFEWSASVRLLTERRPGLC